MALSARVVRGPQRIHADCPLTLATAVAGTSCAAARRWKPAGLPELSYLEPPVRLRRASLHAKRTDTLGMTRPRRHRKPARYRVDTRSSASTAASRSPTSRAPAARAPSNSSRGKACGRSPVQDRAPAAECPSGARPSCVGISDDTNGRNSYEARHGAADSTFRWGRATEATGATPSQGRVGAPPCRDGDRAHARRRRNARGGGASLRRQAGPAHGSAVIPGRTRPWGRRRHPEPHRQDGRRAPDPLPMAVRPPPASPRYTARTPG